MGGRRTSWVGIGGGLLLSANSLALAAVTTIQPERIRIAYEAAVNCPSRSRLIAQVAERVTIAWLADDTELARQIRVVLEPAGAAYVGRMEYVDESGRKVIRSLQAPNCEEAVAGIALVTAMAIESQSAEPTPFDRRSEEGFQAPQPPLANNGLGSASHDGAPSPAKPQTLPVQALPTVTLPVDSSTARVQQRDRVTGSGLEVGAFAGAVNGVGPGVALGGGAFWGIGRAPFPLLRVAAIWYEYRQDSAPTVKITSRFRVISVGPQLCGREPVPGIPDLHASLCAGVEVGQYLAEGKPSDPALYEAQTHRLFWASAQLSVPLRWARSGVFIELQPVVRFPLVRGAFELIHPAQTVHKIPGVAPGLNLALGLTFP